MGRQHFVDSRAQAVRPVRRIWATLERRDADRLRMTAAPPPLRILPEARRLGEGQGLRFQIVLDGIEREAFAVRYRGQVRAYLNTCRHQGLELDFGDAHFFDDAYDALVCCHHGARYRPDTGECLAGPCHGGRLTALAIEERGGELWCLGRARDG